MIKNSTQFQPQRLSAAAMHASRQMWLASLGAAVVTRDWVQTEAGGMFKTLVREGTVVESRAIRFVGDRIETSVSLANSVWKETRRTVQSTVKHAADTAVTIAQQVMPRALPAFELPGTAKPVAKRAKTTVRRARKTAGKAKRRVKAAAKRA